MDNTKGGSSAALNFLRKSLFDDGRVEFHRSFVTSTTETV